MKLSTSYSQILSLSVPIMLGSAAQNIIVLSDNVFLYHYNSVDFAASGLVGVFYLIIASIGYGFSRGGQIIIARRMGEGRPGAEPLRRSRSDRSATRHPARARAEPSLAVRADSHPRAEGADRSQQPRRVTG